jgi:hypothetical protein
MRVLERAGLRCCFVGMVGGAESPAVKSNGGVQTLTFAEKKSNHITSLALRGCLITLNFKRWPKGKRTAERRLDVQDNRPQTSLEAVA